MDLYYPVTPKITLLCRHGGTKNSKRVIKEVEEIEMLNSKMFHGASRQVFNLREDDFHKISKYCMTYYDRCITKKVKADFYDALKAFAYRF